MIVHDSYYNLDDMQAKYIAEHKEMVIVELLKEQHPIGSQVMLRETWGVCGRASAQSHNKYLYKADNYCGGVCLFDCYTIWRSSQSMPLEAIRHKPVVVETRVVEVQDIAVAEKNLLGIEFSTHSLHRLSVWFNRRYNNPRLKCCFSWDDNPWCEIFRVKEEG